MSLGKSRDVPAEFAHVGVAEVVLHVVELLCRRFGVPGDSRVVTLSQRIRRRPCRIRRIVNARHHALAALVGQVARLLDERAAMLLPLLADRVTGLLQLLAGLIANVVQLSPGLLLGILGRFAGPTKIFVRLI